LPSSFACPLLGPAQVTLRRATLTWNETILWIINVGVSGLHISLNFLHSRHHALHGFPCVFIIRRIADMTRDCTGVPSYEILAEDVHIGAIGYDIACACVTHINQNKN
jgi:hypothetical protein